jgi:plasmid stabilization system protein ParE
MHRGAEQDLATAFRFYKTEASPAVARRFLDEFERVARLLEEFPDIGTPTNGDRRMFPLRGFPYTAIYRPASDGIHVLVLRHQSRSPTFGDERA